MKVRIGDCYRVKTAIDELYTTKLPTVTAFRVKKLAKAVGEELKLAEPERQKIFSTYGIELVDSSIDPSGKEWDITGFIDKHPKKGLEFKAEWEKFMSHEVEISFELLEIEDLGNAVIEPKTLDLLEKFIKE